MNNDFDNVPAKTREMLERERNIEEFSKAHSGTLKKEQSTTRSTPHAVAQSRAQSAKKTTTAKKKVAKKQQQHVKSSNNTTATRASKPLKVSGGTPQKEQATHTVKKKQRFSLFSTKKPSATKIAKSTAKNIKKNAKIIPTGSAIAIPKKKEHVKKKREPYSPFDFPFFTIILVLLAFGITMMFSASYATALKEYGDSFYFVSRQIMFAAVGIIAMLVLSFVDYHVFMNIHVMRIMIVVTLGLMALTLLLKFTTNGADRWIKMGQFSFQPSEILKFVIIAYFAYLSEKNYSEVKDFKKGYLPFIITLGVACGLLFLQPHISAAIIVFLIGIVMMFVAGVRTKLLIFTIIGAGVLALLGVLLLKAMNITYMDDRILSFQNPEADIRNDTFQTYQSLVTIGSGGFFGLGFGNSRQKYAYLPYSENDFVFSIVCEELGFVGAMLVIILFIIFIYRGFYIATRARDKFGMLLAIGITFQIGLQALLNIAVVTNSMPNTGISLPFFSYGGSALMMQLGEVGILLNISRKAAIE